MCVHPPGREKKPPKLPPVNLVAPPNSWGLGPPKPQSLFVPEPFFPGLKFGKGIERVGPKEVFSRGINFGKFKTLLGPQKKKVFSFPAKVESQSGVFPRPFPGGKLEI